MRDQAGAQSFGQPVVCETRPAGCLLTLYARLWCHLCDDMLTALGVVRESLPDSNLFAVEVVDVDADPALDERFGEKVPVLMFGEQEICHYFLNEAKLRELLAALR